MIEQNGYQKNRRAIVRAECKYHKNNIDRAITIKRLSLSMPHPIWVWPVCNCSHPTLPWPWSGNKHAMVHGIDTLPWSWSGNSRLRAQSTYRLKHMLLLSERLAQNTSFPKCFWSQYAFSPEIAFFALRMFVVVTFLCLHNFYFAVKNIEVNIKEQK